MEHSILIVDDDLDVLSVLKDTLETDYNVYTASSGSEALEILENEGEKIYLIITDQKMPGMTGMEFLKKTFYTYPDIVKIILTAYKDVSVLIDAINTGKIYKFILKPWDIYELRNTVKRGIELYELEKERKKLAAELMEKNKESSRILDELKNVRKRLFEMEMEKEKVKIKTIKEVIEKFTQNMNKSVNLMKDFIFECDLKDEERIKLSFNTFRKELDKMKSIIKTLENLKENI